MTSAYKWRIVARRVLKLSGTTWCVGYIPMRQRWFALSVRLNRYILAPTREEAMLSAEYAQECAEKGHEIPGWSVGMFFPGMNGIGRSMRFPITNAGRNLQRRLSEYRNGRPS